MIRGEEVDHLDDLLGSGHYIVIVLPPNKAPLATRHEVQVIDRRSGKRAGAAWLVPSGERTRPPWRNMLLHAICYHDRMVAPRTAGLLFMKNREETYGDPPS